MGFRVDNIRQMIRNAFLAAIIFGLLHLVSISDLLSSVSRPLVTFVVGLIGIEAADMGSHVIIGKLVLPWTADCSGINTLVILLGITLWVNRQERFSWPFLTRLILCVPSALVANLFRVLSLAAYRYAFYPAWESQQLHYFIGFIWLLPFILLFVPNFRNKDLGQWVEIFYLMVVLALVALVVFSPGGSLAIVCTLVYLVHNRINGPSKHLQWPAYLLWAIAALLIAWSRMESLWIPWLLICPRFVAFNVLFSWSGIIILSGTVPLLGMRPEWQVVVVAALLFHAYGEVKKQVGEYNPQPPTMGRVEMMVLVCMLLAPFGLNNLIGVSYEIEHPPKGIMIKQLNSNSYNIRIPGQPSDIALYWYGAFSEGRHHSLLACMRFRGVILEELEKEKETYVGNKKWMREFFIYDKQLKKNYSDYLLATFSPFSSPGVHVIFEAPSHLMSSAYFARESENIARHLQRIYAEAL